MNRRIIVLSLLSIFFALVFLWAKFIYFYLSPTMAVHPDVMIVEGWNPDQTLNEAVEAFRQNHYKYIITTGFPETKGFCMGSQGKLVFDIHEAEKELGRKIISYNDGPLTVKITLRGTKVHNEYAHFRVFADSIIIGATYATKKTQTFIFRNKIPPDISAITIEFDNDTYSAFRDRNLYVFSLSVNDITFPVNNKAFKYYRRLSGRYIFSRQPGKTLAHEAAQRLIQKGIPDSLIIPVGSFTKYKSRTYTTATDVMKWCDAHPEYTIESITIFTSGIHARRSFLSFYKVFAQDNIPIGVVSCKDNDIGSDNWWKSFNGIREVIYETAGVIYILLIG